MMVESCPDQKALNQLDASLEPENIQRRMDQYARRKQLREAAGWKPRERTIARTTPSGVQDLMAAFQIGGS